MLAQDIRNARKARGWTQSALAERLGVSLRQVARLERGRASMDLFERAAALLQLEIRGVANG